MLRKFSALLVLLSLLLSSCGSPSTPVVVPVPSVTPPSMPDLVKPAFETGVYPNLFRNYLGKSDEEIQAKIKGAWDQLFYGDDTTERVFLPDTYVGIRDLKCGVFFQCLFVSVVRLYCDVDVAVHKNLFQRSVS